MISDLNELGMTDAEFRAHHNGPAGSIERVVRRLSDDQLARVHAQRRNALDGIHIAALMQ